MTIQQFNHHALDDMRDRLLCMDGLRDKILFILQVPRNETTVIALIQGADANSYGKLTNAEWIRYTLINMEDEGYVCLNSTSNLWETNNERYLEED